MFAHLDDPEPPPSGAALRTAVRRRVRRRRQRRVAVVGGVAAVVGLGAASLVAARERLGPEQIDVAGLPAPDVAPAVGEPMTVLLVGVDGSVPVGDDEGASGALRADTIVAARVDPEAGEIRLLMVPRDLAVPGEPDVRISSLLETGGAEALVRSVGGLGIEIDHYVQVDFAGAIGLVDVLGGVEVSVPAPVRAERTGVSLEAGCHRLDGEQVLGLARSRADVQTQASDGTWHTDPSGDFGRQARAGVLAAALVTAVADVGARELPALVRTGLDMVVVDSGLQPGEVVELARLAGDLRLVTLGLPVHARPPGGPAILDLAEGADGIVAGLEAGGVASGPVVVDGEALGDATGLAPC